MTGYLVLAAIILLLSASWGWLFALEQREQERLPAATRQDPMFPTLLKWLPIAFLLLLLELLLLSLLWSFGLYPCGDSVSNPRDPQSEIKP